MKTIWHPWHKWECYAAGMFDGPVNVDKETAYKMYADFLANDNLFREALRKVLDQWPISCKHFLSNRNINRIAWLGQASACIEIRLPFTCRGGFKMLTNAQQSKANATALEYLRKWEREHKQNTPVHKNVEGKGLFG